MVATTVLQSDKLKKIQRGLQKRITSAQLFKAENPNKITEKISKTLSELEYRQAAVREAITLADQVEELPSYDMHLQCTMLYRKYLVKDDPQFAAFISADKSEEANKARNALYDAIMVFDVDFAYGDIEYTDKCFVAYLEQIVDYFLYFREKYTKISTVK